MPKFIKQTQSLCSNCLKVISADIILEDDNVYMVKVCPDHGNQKTVIWRNEDTYRRWVDFGEDLPISQGKNCGSYKGCPYDCGLCPEHKVGTCVAVIEITKRCNLNCPICFADSGNSGTDIDHHTIRGMFETALTSAGRCSIQLSGGEPTLRDDLPSIVNMGTGLGFEHIMINTNGLRIAQDINYLMKIKEAGAQTIYLQFDGVSGEIYHSIRAKNILDEKIQALRNCALAEIGVVLVPTIVPRINDHQIGEIIKFALKWNPVVKGIHFQPISYFGRFPSMPTNEERITIPDLLNAIESQTNGAIKKQSFVPRKPRESICSFSGLFVQMEDGRLIALTDFDTQEAGKNKSKNINQQPNKVAWQYLKTNWIYQPKRTCDSSGQIQGNLRNLFERAGTHRLSISSMAFQDADNIDLNRLRGCCTHVVTPDKRMIPLCSYYVTNTKGDRLHK